MNQGSLHPGAAAAREERADHQRVGVTDNTRQARSYRITAAGRRALGTELESWKRFAAALDAVLRTT